MSPVYSPYLGRYVPYIGPGVYTFRVTEAGTGAPVANAQCALQDVPLGYKSLEGVGGYTDSNGVCTLDAPFIARYYSVYKAGYVTARGSIPGTQINVSLTPTAVKYWVAIIAGIGGTVDPSGTYQVAANTKITVTATPQTGYVLDYWLINNVKSGNTNPLGATIDRDSYSIYAIFKEAEAPPPPPNGNGATWPVIKQMHAYDNERVEPGLGLYLEKSRTITNVDTSVLLGGKVNYTINYLSGLLHGLDAKIYWNDQEIASVRPVIGTPLTGTVDLTGLISATNTLKIGVSQGPAGFNVVAFDVWLILGYSREPVFDPSLPYNPTWDWIEKNWIWLAGGGVVLGSVYLLTRKGQPLIVMTQPYYPPPSKGEKE